MRIAIVVFSVVPLMACADPRPLGGVGFCFAAASDLDPDEGGFAFQRTEERTGLELVDEADETEPPAAFEDCAAGMAVRAEMVDDGGEHVWLALAARYGAQELIGAEVLQLVDGATLRFDKVAGFVPSSSLSLTVADRPIVVMQGGRPPEETIIEGIAVEGDGPTALPTWLPCGFVTPTALRFSHDEGQARAANGDAVGIIRDGHELLGHNLHTVEVSFASCDDSSGNGVHSTWAVVASSL